MCCWCIRMHVSVGKRQSDRSCERITKLKKRPEFLKASKVSSNLQHFFSRFNYLLLMDSDPSNATSYENTLLSKWRQNVQKCKNCWQNRVEVSCFVHTVAVTISRIWSSLDAVMLLSVSQNVGQAV
jgi:hypothetical protein